MLTHLARHSAGALSLANRVHHHARPAPASLLHPRPSVSLQAHRAGHSRSRDFAGALGVSLPAQGPWTAAEGNSYCREFSESCGERGKPMRRGPKPKSALQVVREGNPGKRPLRDTGHRPVSAPTLARSVGLVGEQQETLVDFCVTWRGLCRVSGRCPVMAW